jgi:hypothetical protein
MLRSSSIGLHWVRVLFWRLLHNLRLLISDLILNCCNYFSCFGFAEVWAISGGILILRVFCRLAARIELCWYFVICILFEPFLSTRSTQLFGFLNQLIVDTLMLGEELVSTSLVGTGIRRSVLWLNLDCLGSLCLRLLVSLGWGTCDDFRCRSATFLFQCCSLALNLDLITPSVCHWKCT